VAAPHWETAVNLPNLLRCSGHVLGTGLLAGVLALAWGPPGAAEEAAPAPQAPAAEAGAPAIPNGKCLSCHDDDTLVDEKERRLTPVHEAEFAASKHRKVACVTCHTGAVGVRHPRQVKDLGKVSVAACLECHEEEIAVFQQSAHASKAHLDEDAANCGKCHGNVHVLPRRPGLEAPLSPVNQMYTCGQCHGDMMEGYLHSSHAKARLAKGLNNSPSCTDCHGGHDILPKDNPESRTSPQKSPEMCGSCHEFVLAHWKNESAHGTLWQEGKKTALCVDCHHAHDVVDPTSVQMRTQMVENCGHCHEEQSKTFRDNFHGKATLIGHERSAACASCHTPHQNLPASDPRSSIHPDNIGKMCGSCHEGRITPAFLTYDPHNNPRDPNDNVYVYWVFVFMVALLLGVFGFFGVHDLLWLQRALVGKLRGEFKAPHHSDGPHVRRFTGGQMAVHVTIILSFLLLAATGLPLKFPETEWSKPIVDLLGGADMAGSLHRFAGTVTFGYFFVHILMVLWDMLVRKEKGYLWGPRSMVPNLKDVQDFIGNIRYFLYLGPKPQLDRWAYWEKFDYLAVFWGVAIIGFSGLMLWFPTFFTQWLPGWTLNAAYVVHSDEALLATGFIFLFHFFHTHLRPDAFPMDPVIFTGRMPLEKFKEDRPLEYARAVREGRLESMLVPPPDKGQLVRAYVFGLAAYVTGLVLAVFIFIGLISWLT
jgi:cytochrome b subunit of formate dehydrogenase